MSRHSDEAALLNSGVRELTEGRDEFARGIPLAVLDAHEALEDCLSPVLAPFNLGVLATQVRNSDKAESWTTQALAAAREIDLGLVAELAHAASGQREQES